MTATELREILEQTRLTQRGAASILAINERTMRRYAAGEPIPRVVELAMWWVKDNVKGQP